MKKSKTIREIPLNEIKVGENYRKPDNIEQIAISIKSQGQLNPVLALKREDGYLIIDGNRRYHGILYANEKLDTKIETIEAILIDEKLEGDDKTLLQMVLNETLDSPLEKAIKIVELVEKGMHALKIAEAFGVKDAYVYSLKKKIVPDEIFRAYIKNEFILRVIDKEDNNKSYYSTNLKSFDNLFETKPELVRNLSKISPGEEKVKLFAIDIIADAYYKLKETDNLDMFHELIAILQHKKAYDKKQVQVYCNKILEKVEGKAKEKDQKDDSMKNALQMDKLKKIFKSFGEINSKTINLINSALEEEKLPIVISLKK
ncbi:MAG TPA: ParB N-terminal domain-containing protein [bacterium]|nr:ParB N-terminal domain-containing protein [bacterium]